MVIDLIIYIIIPPQKDQQSVLKISTPPPPKKKILATPLDALLSVSAIGGAVGTETALDRFRFQIFN